MEKCSRQQATRPETYTRCRVSEYRETLQAVRGLLALPSTLARLGAVRSVPAIGKTSK